MPELPEVEIVRRGLEALLRGHRIERVTCRRPDLRFPFPDDFCARLAGQRVSGVERRAKYLLVRLGSGEVLVIHLGMTGRLTGAVTVKAARPREAGAASLQRSAGRSRRAGREVGAPFTLASYIYDPGHDTLHDHVVLAMSNGTVVTYNDPRRFGFMLLVPETELNAHPLFAGLGVEPLGDDLDVPYLARRAAGRRCDLKSFLMDQRNIAGLGNIYVCEALFRAGLSPKRRAGTLGGRSGKAAEHAARLVSAIRDVLGAAIEAGGSTLRDYRHADGEKGSFQENFLVYGREGEPCRRPSCSGTVRRLTQSARSTFYCPACQR